MPLSSKVLMPLVSDLKFKSDEIGILAGFDGLEHKSISSWSRKFKDEFPSRIAIAINRHYPELESGFYLNRRLLALVQESFLTSDLHVVIEDNFRKSDLVPSELPGCLEESDDYLLVNSKLQKLGRLRIWNDLGSRSPFYHDHYIIEVVSSHNLSGELVTAVRDNCFKNSVACEIKG